jgi:hypothetical protein
LVAPDAARRKAPKLPDATSLTEVFVVNPVLDRLAAQRAEQLAAMDAVLAQVGDDRDLVDAEKSLLMATQQRVEAIDAQIELLAPLEAMKAAHVDALPAVRPDMVAATARRADGVDRPPEYRSTGHFLADYCRARGCQEGGGFGDPDPGALRRVQAIQARVVADQKTTDTTGILPTPIVGAVVSLIDSNRPLIASLGGAKGLGGIPGTTFSRPKVTQHTTVGQQTTGANEKTQLSSQKMTITPVNFAKTTYGGTVDISRQDIDWTSPAAWDILVRDLAQVYAVQTETAVAAAFVTAATGTKPAALPAAPVLADWAKGLYTAAMHSYQAAFMMPDRVWCSLDVWAALGSLVDVARVVLPVDVTREMGAPGTSNLASFQGDIFGLPRIVAPTLPAKTCIVGPSALYEVYEEVIGLLSVVEPSILGVQVAYGGYFAQGSLAGTAFVPLDLSVAVLPTIFETEADSEPEAPAPAAGAAKKQAG